MRSSLPFFGAVASLSAMGCAVAPSSSDAPDAEAVASSTSAVIVVERTLGPGEGNPGVSGLVTGRGDAVIARFVRVRQGTVDQQALRMAGVAQELPAIGTCSTTADDDATLQRRAVELLDVGPVTLDAALASTAGTLSAATLSGAKGATVLLPRTMPDPAGVVSGVYYSARTGDAYAPGGGVAVALRAGGGPDLSDGFAINVVSPHDVIDVRIAPAGAGLDVFWDATDSDPRDLVYVDVFAVAPTARLLSRCTSVDAGRLMIPSSALGATEDGQISVHRLHRESFRAKGIDPGEVRFDVARVVPFRR